MARARRERLASGDFDAVMKDPIIRVRAGALRLLARPNGLEHSRLGFIVGKRQLPAATDRNRLKRQVRARFHTATLPVSLDVVVRLVGGKRSLDRAALANENSAWSRTLFEKFDGRIAKLCQP